MDCLPYIQSNLSSSYIIVDLIKVLFDLLVKFPLRNLFYWSLLMTCASGVDISTYIPIYKFISSEIIYHLLWRSIYLCSSFLRSYYWLYLQTLGLPKQHIFLKFYHFPWIVDHRWCPAHVSFPVLLQCWKNVTAFHL